MFDKTIQKFTKKVGKSVRSTIEPIKKEMTKAVDGKVDIYSRLLKLGVLVFLFVEGFKRVGGSGSELPPGTGTIIINNYIHTKEGGNE